MAYLVYGLLMLTGAGYLNYRGVGGWADVTEVKNVPKSIRDNPGSYRSHYRFLPRYYGGK
jgi:hypothetical protein